MTQATTMRALALVAATAVGFGAAMAWRQLRPSEREQEPIAAQAAPFGRCRSPFAANLAGGGFTTSIARRLKVRAPGEWPGLPVDETFVMLCRTTQDCRMTNACVEGRCLGCDNDRQCAEHEVCVLGHCLVERLAGCRSATDCGPEEWCVISGYSTGGRNNGESVSSCRPRRASLVSGGDQPWPPPPRRSPSEAAAGASPPTPPQAPRHGDIDAFTLLESLREAPRP